MQRKSVWLAALLGGCLLPALARAQFYEPPPTIVPGSGTATPKATEPSNDYDRFLNWETHGRPGCCGGVSDKPALQTEVYFRTGASFIVGGGIYGHSLETGFAVQGGAKAMFFNQYFDAAWYVDLGISNSQNSANSHPSTVSLIVDDVATLATIRGLNRTFVNVGVGRAFYLWAPADAAGTNLRLCVDGGGRYGTAKGDFYEITHETDVIGGAYAGVQTDLEIPCGRYVFQVGLRLEYGYTWSDMLQRKSDVQDVNLLLQAGIRY